ncbi:MAG: HEAT repeat domain-containing protein [Pirellulales bacterium]
MATWWPWHEPDQTADLAKYGPISRQKIEQLEELREVATPPADLHSSLAERLRHESDPMVRLEVVRTLAAFPSDQSRMIIAAALQDPDVDVRVTACQALGKLGGADSSRRLGQALASDTSVDVRIAATKALGEMHDPQAVPLLAVALEDPDPALQFSGVEAMRLATGKDLGNDVNRWRQFARNPDPNAAEERLADKVRRAF